MIPRDDYPPASTPTLSVVICTRDRPAALRATLDALWTQTHHPEELIVVDDVRLPRDVHEYASARCASLGIRFVHVDNRGEGLTRGRNRGAAEARCDVLLYLDDDATCAQGCLAEIVDLFRDPRVAGVTASVEEPALGSRGARLYQLGYKLALWWSIRPRGRPRGPGPPALRDPRRAVRARWLSGCAMALRRSIVLKNPFDESLSGYALGEDREMTCRLAARHWLLDARRARVVHRREPSQRTDPRRLGRMTVCNYVHVLRRNGLLGVGQAILVGWSVFVLAMMHVLWAIAGDRRAHLLELLGLCEGAISVAVDRLRGRPVGSAVGNSNSLPRDLAAGLARRGRQKVSSVELGTALEHRDIQPRVAHRDGPQAARLKPAFLARPIRALFITNRLEHGGAERMLLTLVRGLRSHGVEPIIGCLKDAGPLADECRRDGILVLDGILDHKFDARALPRLRSIVRHHRIDILVAAHSGGDRMFWTTLAGLLTRRPIVVWSHWFPTRHHAHVEPVNRLLARGVDAFVALGRLHRDALVRHAHLPAGRIAVIPNGLDLASAPDPATRPTARRTLGLAQNDVAVVIVANLRPEKRHDVFIRAAAAAHAHNSDLRFFILGDGPHRPAVLEAIRASGLDARVIQWLGARDDVRALLPGMDVTCLCSDVETFSVTMLEAAAAGVAFIGPRVGSLPEFLDHGRTGLLIEPGDAAGLADAIGELSADARRRRTLAEAARRLLLAEFTAERMIERFADLLKALGPLARNEPKGANGELLIANCELNEGRNAPSFQLAIRN